MEIDSEAVLCADKGSVPVNEGAQLQSSKLAGSMVNIGIGEDFLAIKISLGGDEPNQVQERQR